MSMPFPPPPAAPEKKRKLWPWFLGGCLVLILAAAALIGVGYLGAKWIGAEAKDTLTGIPVVEEHFGAITDAGLDFEAMGAAPDAMIYKIVGEKGEGRLVIQMDKAMKEIESASLALPNGAIHKLDAATLDKLKTMGTMEFSGSASGQVRVDVDAELSAEGGAPAEN